VATTLAEAIRRSGLTKTECAESSGVSRSQLYMYETGRLRPELQNATRIAGALGVEVGEIAEFTSALEEAEARRVEEFVRDLRERVLGEGREVHIAVGDLPNWLRDELAKYARQNPERVRHLTLDLSLEEMQTLVDPSKDELASKNGEAS
jgi:transcriptional regulator with XRE-family HTH domain